MPDQTPIDSARLREGGGTSTSSQTLTIRDLTLYDEG